MWARRYWAVLGFEMLLGVAIVGAAISLMRASNLAGVALCLGLIGRLRTPVLVPHPGHGAAADAQPHALVSAPAHA